MLRYEYAILFAIHWGDPVNRWEAFGSMPDGTRREFPGVGSLVAMNELGAEGWAMVSLHEQFFSAPQPQTQFTFWLCREVSP